MSIIFFGGFGVVGEMGMGVVERVDEEERRSISGIILNNFLLVLNSFLIKGKFMEVMLLVNYF